MNNPFDEVLIYKALADTHWEEIKKLQRENAELKERIRIKDAGLKQLIEQKIQLEKENADLREHNKFLLDKLDKADSKLDWY